MWSERQQWPPLGLNEATFARCLTAGKRERFRLSPGPAVYDLGPPPQRITAAGDGGLDLPVGRTILLARETDAVAVAFDSLRSKDRCLMEIHLEIRLRLADAGRFHAGQMIGRAELSRSDVARLVQERIKFPARRAVREFGAESLDGDLNARRTVEEIMGRGGELHSWAQQHGLVVESIEVIECFPTLDPLATRAELEQARAAGDAALEDAIERLRRDQAVRKHGRLLEILDSEARVTGKLADLLAWCERQDQRDQQRCQQCHAVTEDGFHCRECGRWLCSIHEAEQGVCRNCRTERRQETKSPGDDVYKCPISGHFVVRTATFECPRCQTVACEHCYDSASRQCVRCAAAAAQQTTDSRRRSVFELLAGLRTLPQLRDLRLWCDTNRAVRRGVGVAPRSDVRVFHLGDDIRFQYLAEFDGFLRLIAVQSDGTSVPLFPNERCADYHLEGGRVRSFPEAGEDVRYFAQPPVGLDTIVAVMSPVPFRLFADDPLLPDDGPTPPSCQRLQDEPATWNVLQTILDRVQSGQWSCAECQLLVRS